ncbi:recombinase RecA [Alteromonas ponticola]|uniref:Recombinase RecA n=1 Tax=Alteromonas ponticola TaxID=2720613 RepID=A0ABX1QZZ8_9ALTE|nr:recombinase RecA [Alteromonas ponticola]NMH59792.1 recombinase RecA [Alteromonas ponticola]
MSDNLHLLTKHPQLWRASYPPSTDDVTKVASGFALLDDALGGGWPTSGLVRLRSYQGIGEVELFLSLLNNIRHQRLLMFINAPGHIQAGWFTKHKIPLENIYALSGDHDDCLWAAEQCLKSAVCQVVMLWSTRCLSLTQARRLQVSAKQHHSTCILFEYEHVLRQSLPVELDLSVARAQNQVNLNIEKQLGGWPRADIPISYSPIPTNQPILSAFAHYVAPNAERTKVS